MAVPRMHLCPTAVSRPYSVIRNPPVRIASLHITYSAVAWIGFRNYTLTLMPFNFIISDLLTSNKPFHLNRQILRGIIITKHS